MLHDGSVISESFSRERETPRPSYSYPPSLSSPNMALNGIPKPPVVDWDWDLEKADRMREAKADTAVHGAQPFHVDRNLLRDVVKEKLGYRVGRITFLNSGASHLCFFPLPNDKGYAPGTTGTFHKVCSLSCFEII